MLHWTSNHEDFSSRQKSEPVAQRCFIENCSEKNLHLSLFFNKEARLTLLKIDSGTCVFQEVLQNFEEYLFSKTDPHGCF